MEVEEGMERGRGEVEWEGRGKIDTDNSRSRINDHSPS